ncbi:hypothetical protein AB0N38_18190 [Micromonospora aurantiaca]|uniref:Uncharacterized protein n=2 Tax=Micromonospora TaxID=1873 RepID=A0A1C6TKR0_9ACTN|nr:MULTISPECIES: hypothetical protein [Micromonospora]ADL48346.1 hypothetical protein Micau_4837 [Micromonospora aurantiaca ATCC 27029]ADU08976.1 hypothetical protein ML5_3462 [Micromonospora sp. L5]AXH88531.1 hypothetical protein DVH21_00500 [Micromonospora aurantiaca]EWM68143.1 hypothetical protein MCBG_05276 [Micromonospora sp. M42]MBC8993259.1 hypothetical protein [Micromonospora chalcea]
MIQKRIAQWAVMAVAVPLAAAGARRLSHTLEARRGPSGVSRLLTKGADLIRPQKARRRRFF